jgi:hypothetical protein
MTPEPPPGACSRRALLRAGLVGAGGLVVASAMPDLAWANPSPMGAFVFSSDLYASSLPQRFVFVFAQGGSTGIKYVSGPPTTIRFRDPSGTWIKPVKAPLDPVGLPKGRGV